MKRRSRKPRILFVAEAVTLAHVTRLLTLAKALNQNAFDIFLAADRTYDLFLNDMPAKRLVISSIPPKQFLRSLETGKWLYSASILGQYIEEELHLFENIKPDVVVGDFRHSLAVSAPVWGVPYLNLTNAYWSPYAASQAWTIPAYTATRFLGVNLANRIFQFAKEPLLRYNARPLNRVRKQYGLPAFESFLHGFTFGDYTLYADTPLIAQTEHLPSNHIYLGPIVWSPPFTHPEWWDSIPKNYPVIYATLGSSGASKTIAVVAEALADLPITVLLATAGKSFPGAIPNNFLIADYLPGTAACQKADFVICNGGSPSAYQALSYGKPIIGIASNLDQFLSMKNIVAADAGITLRTDTISSHTLRHATVRLSSDPKYVQAAKFVASDFARYDAPTGFRQIIEEVVRDTTYLEVNHFANAQNY
ncbi:glycosyl transferase family 1 [Oligoflexia bacterium]|nr:glycosyl transferase family 1 [Oligoflexia bacterium]